ncbi:Pao retrotransposon peptidase family protein [Corchorus olitorius]|uniref:Pao retrotransposon peptidase family protein n=1 Tax=Corchorus olitorius TaxID=93759 RepID=A0A1R3JH22_9ROSI|nr:Pao retrotransposon peptidase family protein [Corchorus olitorius]
MGRFLTDILTYPSQPTIVRSAASVAVGWVAGHQCRYPPPTTVKSSENPNSP